MSYASEVLADSPLFWGRLGEASGGTLVDSSGNGRNGIYANAMTLAVSGAITDGDTAVKASAASSYGKVTGASWMNTANWTVEAWVNRGSSSTFGYIFTREAGPGQTVASDYIWSLRINSSGQASIVIFKGGGAVVVSGAATLANNTWYHVAATLNGSTLTLYVNGVSVGSESSGGTISRSSATDMVVANIETTSSGNLSSANSLYSTDEVAFYGTALSAARLLAHYNAGIALPPIALTTVKGTATASAPAPSMKMNLPFAIPKATATAAALAVVLTIGPAPLSFAIPKATATATAPAPALTMGPFGFSPPPATATVSAPAPGLAFGAFAFTIPKATATAAAIAPSLNIAGAPLELAVPKATATATALPPSISIPLFIPTDDETADVDLEDDDDDLELTPPLALPPAGFAERVIWRRSVIVPDLSAYPKDPITGQPHVSDEEYAAWEADAIVEEIGVPHLIFPDNDDPNDVTYYRGQPLQGLKFTRSEPFGDKDADVTIPGIKSMDTHPDDPGSPHPFTRPRANFEILMKRSDGHTRRLWSGNAFTRDLGNDGTQPTMAIHALGSLYMANAARNRPVVSDVPLDFGYLVPRAFNLVGARRYKSIAHVNTGIPPTLMRGAWGDSPMGFALDCLAQCWTDDGSNQWTIAKVVGTRRQYEMRLKHTTPAHTFTNGARGVNVALQEDDNGRNVVFGHGVNSDGGIWFNTKYPDNGGVIRLPLAADPRTQKWLYDSDGNITGANPDFDGNVMPREDDVDFGQNSKAIGIRSAQQIVDRESQPSFVGTITVETDPREGWRGDIQAGDKMTLIGYQGRDLVLHITDVSVDLDNPKLPVTLTVDERSRDAMTVAQIRTRNKEARRDPALRPGNPNRRSRLEQDQIVPFDDESKAGRIVDRDGNPLVVQGGRWNVFSIPFATAGRIQKVHFNTGSPMVAGFFAFRPSTAVLNLRIGNPHTNEDPFEWFMDDPNDTYGFLAGWGQKDQRMGYSPYAETADGFIKAGPFSGKFDEATGFDYVAQANARLYFAVYTASDTTVSGRCFPALVV